MIIGLIIGIGIGFMLPLVWQHKDAIIARIKEVFGQKFD
jgi:hypothetical protein